LIALFVWTLGDAFGLIFFCVLALFVLIRRALKGKWLWREFE
jgi:hypothetical protein